MDTRRCLKDECIRIGASRLWKQWSTDLEKREICLQRRGRLDRFVDSSGELEILPGTKEFARLDEHTPICRGVDRPTAKVSFAETIPIVSVKASQRRLKIYSTRLIRPLIGRRGRERERENYSTFRMRARWMENLRDDEKSTGLHAKIKVYFFVVNFIQS